MLGAHEQCMKVRHAEIDSCTVLQALADINYVLQHLPTLMLSSLYHVWPG